MPRLTLSHRTTVRALGVGSCLAALSLSAPAQMPPQTLGRIDEDLTTSQQLAALGGITPQLVPEAEYDHEDNPQESWSNLVIVPVRPMAMTADNLDLYVLNSHDSRVLSIDFNTPVQKDVWRVPFGPTSLAIFDGHPDGIERLLVVSQGSHVMTILDRMSGVYLDVIDLPFEPADVIVDATAMQAFVSCAGVDIVAQVDLVSLAVTEWAIPATHPTHLAFDTDGSVLVAPMISGNNSTATGIGPMGSTAVYVADLDDPLISPFGLPDEDLFRIDWAGGGTVAAVARQMGTNLFGMGINPSTLNLWQLNIEALNKDPSMQSEPALNGIFALNRLTVTTLNGVGGALKQKADHTFHDLDDSDAGTVGQQIDRSRTVGIPTGLGFSQAGFAVVSGLATDNVTLLAPSGAQGEGTFVLEFDVPDGSLPRQVMFDRATESAILVYCWGSNRLETYTLTGVHQPGRSFDLGFDPMPDLVKLGRDLFHDASKSLNNNVTCGTCHIDGRTDSLAWNLSNAPFDDKGPLVTQTLKGIDKRAPYHWRGERKVLEDFNGAFEGLLGGGKLDEAPGGEFDQFKAFVFSLREPPNPGQDERNILNDALAPVEENGLQGSAVAGQDQFTNVLSLPPFSCIDCHALPTGSGDVSVLEVATSIPNRMFMDVAGFGELFRKDQPMVQVQIFGNPTNRVRIGAGLLHDGANPNLFRFVDRFPPLNQQSTSDITAFLRQLPSGIAPFATKAELWDQAHPDSNRRISSYMRRQAGLEHGDLVVFGTYPDTGGVVREVNWMYFPGLDRFVPDNSSQFVPQRYAQMKAAVQSGQASLLVLGLPLGNGERAALDYDLDDLFNQDEAQHGADPLVADTDGDGFPDGHEVKNGGDPADDQVFPMDTTSPQILGVDRRWATARNARVVFRTSEPTSFRVDYTTPAGVSGQFVEGAGLHKVHSVILTNLLPSTFGPRVPVGSEVFHDYSGTITVTDAAGLTAVVALPMFNTGAYCLAGNIAPPAIIKDLAITQVVRSLSGGSMVVRGTIEMVLRAGGPPLIPARDMVAAFNVVVNNQIHSNILTSHPQSFDQKGVPFVALPGPWVLTDPTDATGVTTWQVTVQGLAAGDEVVLNPLLVQYIDPLVYDPQNPDFGDATVNQRPGSNYIRVATESDQRTVSVTF